MPCIPRGHLVGNEAGRPLRTQEKRRRAGDPHLPPIVDKVVVQGTYPMVEF